MVYEILTIFVKNTIQNKKFSCQYHLGICWKLDFLMIAFNVRQVSRILAIFMTRSSLQTFFHVGKKVA